MQATSKAYKNEQKQALREKSHVYVYLGVINQDAQRTAAISTPVTSWSKPPTQGSNMEGIYATYEEDFFRADGSMMFPPNGTWAMYQGAASASLKGTMRFDFNASQNIKGMTIRFFDDATPTKFQITNGTDTYTYEPDPDVDFDDNGNWSCEDEFDDSLYIEIIPIEMLNQRLRVETVLFGKGFYFQDEQLLSTSRKNTIAHLSDRLPSKSFSFTIDNSSKKFAADDPHSFLHFLQGQQEVSYDYGRDLPDGTTYLIRGGKTYLKTWSNDDQKASFETAGYLDFMDSTYYKGDYAANGASLYQLAESVLQDAGITEYRIDSYLKSVITHNPLPIERHKNLLQLIANAGRCVFFEDRNGVPTISSSFESEVTSVTANNAAPHSLSDLTDLFEDRDVIEYATYEKDFFRADGSFYNLPASGYLDCGYVSGTEANETGVFLNEPTITVVWNSAWTWYNMVLTFGTAVPTKFTIYLYDDNTLEDSFVVEDAIDTTTLIEHDFYQSNKMVIEFNKAEPNQRIHLKKIQFGSITDYTITYNDMTQQPVAVTTEFVKNVISHFYEFTNGTETKQIGSFDAVVGDNVITFSNASHDISVAYESGTGTISNVTSGAYYVKFTASVAGKVVVTGKEYTIIDSEVKRNIQRVGADKTSKNILIDNYNAASLNNEWMADYYKNDVEYSITYRGEPAIDCDDQIYIESKYVSSCLVRVTEETIETSQGMNPNCTLKARRVSYSEPTRVDYAIVDVSEVN